jgi:hypothetical protein
VFTPTGEDDGMYCVIVTYRSRHGCRIFGTFPSYDDAAKWCDRRRTSAWRIPAIVATPLPEMEDPSQVDV